MQCTSDRVPSPSWNKGAQRQIKMKVESIFACPIPGMLQMDGVIQISRISYIKGDFVRWTKYSTISWSIPCRQNSFKNRMRYCCISIQLVMCFMFNQWDRSLDENVCGVLDHRIDIRNTYGEEIPLPSVDFSEQRSDNSLTQSWVIWNLTSSQPLNVAKRTSKGACYVRVWERRPYLSGSVRNHCMYAYGPLSTIMAWCIEARHVAALRRCSKLVVVQKSLDSRRHRSCVRIIHLHRNIRLLHFETFKLLHLFIPGSRVNA